MVFYKNGRFHIGKLSFVMPDGVYINTMPYLEMEEGFLLVTPDNKFTITIMGECEKVGAKDYLEELLASFQPISPIQQIQVHDDFIGYYALYTQGATAYCEYRFELPEDENGINTVSVLITTDNTPGSAQKAMEHPSTKELLNSLILCKTSV